MFPELQSMLIIPFITTTLKMYHKLPVKSMHQK